MPTNRPPRISPTVSIVPSPDAPAASPPPSSADDSPPRVRASTPLLVLPGGAGTVPIPVDPPEERAAARRVILPELIVHIEAANAFGPGDLWSLQGLATVPKDLFGMTTHAAALAAAMPLGTALESPLAELNRQFATTAMAGVLEAWRLPGLSAVEDALATLRQSAEASWEAVSQTAWAPYLQRERTAVDWAGEIVDPDRTEEERLAIAAKLAPAIGYWPRDGRALRVLTARARADGRSPQSVIHDETLAAIYIVADLARRQVTLRVTKHMSEEQAGHMATAVPYDDLPVWDYWLWFRRQVHATINQSMLELPSNKPRWEPDHEPEVAYSDHFVDVEPTHVHTVEESDPLAALLDDERASEMRRQLLSVAERSTDRERALIRLLGHGHSTPEAARILGIAPGTARVMLKHIRDRVRSA